MRAAGLAVLLACASAPAAALSGDADITQVLGPDAYEATSAYLTLKSQEGWYIRPSYFISHSRGAPVSRTYLGRVGRESESYNAGFGGGITPISGGYQSYTLGGDASVSWGEDLRWTFGMGSDFVRHAEFIPEMVNRAGRRRTLAQVDAYFPAGVSYAGFEWTLEYRRSLYDLAIPARPRAARRALARGSNPIVFGLPTWHGETELTYTGWSMAAPFVGFGYTAYKVEQSAARSYTLGIRSTWKALKLTTSYEIYDAGGSASNIGYWSLGVGVEF